jgi:hypothetical protein
MVPRKNGEGLAKRSEIEQESRPGFGIRGQHQPGDVEQSAEAGKDLGGRDVERHQPHHVNPDRAGAQSEKRDPLTPAAGQHVRMPGVQLCPLVEKHLVQLA